MFRLLYWLPLLAHSYFFKIYCCSRTRGSQIQQGSYSPLKNISLYVSLTLVTCYVLPLEAKAVAKNSSLFYVKKLFLKRAKLLRFGFNSFRKKSNWFYFLASTHAQDGNAADGNAADIQTKRSDLDSWISLTLNPISSSFVLAYGPVVIGFAVLMNNQSFWH